MPDCVTAFSYQINLLLKDGFCLSMTMVRTIILILLANFALPLIPSCVVTLRKARLYNLNLVKPHFYIVNLEFTGINIIFLISAQKHRLWIFVRNALVNWSLHVGITIFFLFPLKNIDCGYSLETPWFERVPKIYVLRRNMKNIRFFYRKTLRFWW